jgi:hypothetical protein
VGGREGSGEEEGERALVCGGERDLERKRDFDFLFI